MPISLCWLQCEGKKDDKNVAKKKKSKINKSELSQHLNDYQGTHQIKIDRLKTELSITRNYLRNNSVRTNRKKKKRKRKINNQL